jgi:hypothetical protein
MTGDQSRFLVIKREKGGNVTFGNDDCAKIVDRGTVNLGNEKSKPDNVLLIENMKHKLLIFSQMCYQGHIISFDSKKFEIRSKKLRILVATTFRSHRNICILDEIRGEKCCMGKIDQIWLWIGEWDTFTLIIW